MLPYRPTCLGLHLKISSICNCGLCLLLPLLGRRILTVPWNSTVCPDQLFLFIGTVLLKINKRSKCAKFAPRQETVILKEFKHTVPPNPFTSCQFILNLDFNIYQCRGGLFKILFLCPWIQISTATSATQLRPLLLFEPIT